MINDLFAVSIHYGELSMGWKLYCLFENHLRNGLNKMI